MNLYFTLRTSTVYDKLNVYDGLAKTEVEIFTEEGTTLLKESIYSDSPSDVLKRVAFNPIKSPFIIPYDLSDVKIKGKKKYKITCVFSNDIQFYKQGKKIICLTYTGSNTEGNSTEIKYHSKKEAKKALRNIAMSNFKSNIDSKVCLTKDGIDVKTMNTTIEIN